MGVFGGFFGIFLQFFGIFLQFFWNFLQFFWKIFPKIFAIFFDFCDFPTIFPENFSENSCPQSVTVQPGFRHYCKFTSKFTPKFTLILIKILQSTKFEGSHFYSFLATFTTFRNLMPTSQTFSLLCALSFSLPRFLNHSSAVPKTQTAVPPLTTAEVCGQYEGL